MTDVRFLYVTAPSLDVALAIGRELVESKLAACVNAWPGMRSIYRWKGLVEEAEESVLIVKTTVTQADAARARIVQLHPSDVPCVVDFPVTGGNPSYLDWVRAESTPAP